MTPDTRRLLRETNQIVMGLTAGQGTHEDLRAALRRLCDVLGGDNVGIWRAAERVFQLVLSAGEGDDLPQTVPSEEPLLALVVHGLETQIMDNLAAQETESAFGGAGYRMAISAPSIWRGQVLGALVVLWRGSVQALSDDHALVVQLVAQAATCVLNPDTGDTAVKLKDALAAEEERLLHIQVAVQQMLMQPSVDANLQDVLEAIRASGWRRALLALFDDEGQIERLLTSGMDEQEYAWYEPGIIPGAVWERLHANELEQFRIGGLYYVPADETNDPAWHTDDLLFAVLRVGGGMVAGVLRIETPVDQKRPPVAALRALDILISQTAYIVENARLLKQVSESADALADQVEELSMMHRADRELSTHLDVERIMRLTMDWALRRTGASTGLLMLTTQDRRGLVPSVTMGYIDRDMFPYSAEEPLPLSLGVIGRAARTSQTQLVRDVKADKDYVPFIPDARAYVSIPLLMRGEPLGVLTLASSRVNAFDATDVSFLERLARRAAVAFDNARLFRQSEQLADDMAVLYTASRTISSTLERDEVLQRIAQAITVALECSSAVIFDYQPETDEAQVLAVYRLGTAYDAQEVLPEVKQKVSVRTFPAFEAVLEQQHSLVLRAADPAISHLDRQHLLEDKIHTMVLVPLTAQDEMIGLAVVVEGRHDRMFTANEVFKAETLASQAALALRQSMLYSEVLELERLKSEMIRMASHDLRNPLNNIMGYVELLAKDLEEAGIVGEEMMFIDNLRQSSRVMRSLLEDLLTLERIESERQSEWQVFDLGGLVTEVVTEHLRGADLKKQTLVFERPREMTPLFGSMTQMRQAVSNLIGNAIKYTPDEGRVEVHLVYAERRLDFKVIDNGYGISEERQKRIFERFYRAQEPGTDHISGTGLGLSLVKAVIERHGGQVWFKSVPGVGSTFGFWVPAGDERH